MIIHFHGHLEFGTVPDWVAAIGTTLAFWVALSVLLRDRTERRQRQASQASAWIRRGATESVVLIANKSEIPIYNVRAFPLITGQTLDIIRCPVIEPETNLEAKRIEIAGGQDLSNRFLAVEMLFTDSVGRKWKRTSDGKLKRKWRKYE